jgi:hypothetical protein
VRPGWNWQRLGGTDSRGMRWLNKGEGLQVFDTWSLFAVLGTGHRKEEIAIHRLKDERGTSKQVSTGFVQELLQRCRMLTWGILHGYREAGQQPASSRLLQTPRGPGSQNSLATETCAPFKFTTDCMMTGRFATRRGSWGEE